jgi:carboxyl-terminal processing protease
VEVRDLLDEAALEPPKETSATAGAIQGLLESGGDKYGAYFDEEHYGYFNEDMAGEFGGIGVLLGEKEGTAYVVEVYEDTPADRGGLKAGDIFASIDGISREKWTSDEVVKRGRGKEGTKVKLTLLRPGKTEDPHEPVTVTLTRELIQFPNVESRIEPGKVGYIRLGQFNGQATEEIAAEIEKLEEQGATSFVLDLRDNPGGALDQAISVTSLFIPSGVVVRVAERSRPEVEYRTIGSKITDAPLVVLINANSASASEIVGGALQDYGRATLVGVKSFGKGSVQTIKELSFGGAVKFTTAHYLTPKKRVIDGKGLTPDVVVEMDVSKQADPKTDTQLGRAIEEARQAR